MELVYLWIGKDKIIENQGFNFSPRFKCQYIDDELKVEFIGNKDNNFFSKNIEVTAVVGENGSGKSSLIQQLLFYHSNSAFMYVDSANYEYKIWVSDGISKFVEEITFQEYISNKNIILYHEDIDSMLYKNQYNANQIIANIIGTEDRYIIHNIAISTYVHVTKANMFQESKFIPTHLELKFIKTIDLSNIIGYRYEQDDDWHDRIAHLEINETNIYKLNEFFEIELEKAIQKFEQENDLKDYLYLREYLYKVTNRDQKSINIIIEIISNNYQKEDILQVLKNSLFSGDKEKIFREITDNVNNFKFDSYGNMEVSLTDNLESFLLNVHRGFFDINFFRKIDESKVYLSDLSSGELKFINIFSIIFYIARKKYKNVNKDYLLILDEPDTYLHPSWQKKIISYLVSFFENTSIFQQTKIQILITSHSPFILSDIPKKHVLFMKNGKQISAFDKKETFGANIHTLLSDGFFMDDGLMGEFAKEKINKIIENLNDKKYAPEDDEKTNVLHMIKLIGEPFLKRKLLDMYYKKFNDEYSKAIRKKELEIEQARIIEELKKYD